MARKTWHVVYEGGKWKVQRPNSRATSTHTKKTAAIRKAKRIAKRNKPSEIKIHNKKGRISDRHTYKNDPYPPRG